MSSHQIPYFICKDENPKTHCLIIDGGLKNGQYRLILCNSCYNIEEKKFVISEEVLQ